MGNLQLCAGALFLAGVGWGGGLSQKNLAPAKGRAERGLGLSKSHSLGGTHTVGSVGHWD